MLEDGVFLWKDACCNLSTGAVGGFCHEMLLSATTRLSSMTCSLHICHPHAGSAVSPGAFDMGTEPFEYKALLSPFLAFFPTSHCPGTLQVLRLRSDSVNFPLPVLLYGCSHTRRACRCTEIHADHCHYLCKATSAITDQKVLIRIDRPLPVIP
ncbi:hypothetical protein EDD15DRAFT_1144968 [Pisolithus albus]|nr:hypothetical protein EDD15DRAFT_1144968 [Pisolithus albus]